MPENIFTPAKLASIHIDKICDMALDPEACQKYQIAAIKTIQNINGHALSPTLGLGFAIGDRVRKVKGASWQGLIVGFYSTELTPVGYAVESELEKGSVQIYPESALEKI